MMKINIDMDGVVVNFMGPWIEQYNSYTGENIKLRDITGTKTSKFVGDPAILYKIKDSPGFIRSLPPIDGAVDAIHELYSNGHRIKFVTSPTRAHSCGREKEDWLHFHFHKLWRIPPLIVLPKHLKCEVMGDVLLEDTPGNLERLPDSIKGLLYHNRTNISETRFDRIYDWSHFLEWVAQNG